MLRLELDLAIADGHVSGTVRTPDGSNHSFSGWLGLMATLERLAAEPSLGDRT